MWPVLPAYRGRLFHRLLSLSLTTSVCASPCVCLTAVWINSQSRKQSSDSLSRDSSKDAFSFPFLFTHNRNVHVQKKEKKIHIGTKAMLQFIHIFRLTHKNIVQYHSYFRGHLQNQLSARGHLRLHLRLWVGVPCNWNNSAYFLVLFWGCFFSFCFPAESLPGSHDSHMTPLVAN